MQYEREPLRRFERLEDHEECEPDRVGAHRIGFRIAVGASDNWIGNVHVQGVLPARGPRPQHVQAHPRHDGRQPGAQVLDATDIGPAEPNPAFLNRIVCFAR